MLFSVVSQRHFHVATIHDILFVGLLSMKNSGFEFGGGPIYLLRVRGGENIEGEGVFLSSFFLTS